MSPPIVRLAGSCEHPDFRDAVELLRRESKVEISESAKPELIVVAQSRPGEVSAREVLLLQRQYPLAGVVALLGSWCEGETRTGRPWPGVRRLYWHEFPAWWSRQAERRTAGRCPEWANAGEWGVGSGECGQKSAFTNGLVVVCTAVRETADAIGDVLGRAGYATLWYPMGRTGRFVRGVTAAVWDGGQWSTTEENDFKRLRRELGEAVPIVALLDFPRRDRVERARSLGAAAVVGKPWNNAEFIKLIEQVASRSLPSVTNKHAA